MIETNILTFILIAAFAAALFYKVSFLRNKMIGNFSLLQIIYLVVIPGFLYTFVFAYIRSVLERPLNEKIIVSDSLLSNVILLSALFSYGGIAIHATSKMLSEVLRNEDSKAKELNKYFHLQFSHNLAYSGSVSAFIATTLLELNHISTDNIINPVSAIVKGIILGLSLSAGMYWYTTSDNEEYIGRWSDLKTTFLVFWIGAFTTLYGIKKTNPAFREFDLLIPSLAAFSVIASLNLILIYKKLRKGGFSLSLRLGKRKIRII